MTSALLDIVARYVSPSKSTNKQWNAPCPFCGGDDRFIILPYDSDHSGKEMPPHAFCRQCNAWVTAEMLLQRKENISYRDAKAIVDGAKSLSEVGHIKWTGKAKPLTPAEIDGAPVQEWQWGGKAVCRVYKAVLWSEVGVKALQWLRERGISDKYIDSHELGYNPQDYSMDWGTGQKIFLPRGIVIPYLGQEQLWKIEIRRPTHAKKDRYVTVTGSANTLYGYDRLSFRGKAVMTEGVFDAIIMEQALEEAGITDVVAVATGSTDGSRESRWKAKLSLCDHAIIAFDPDEAGENAAHYWLRIISEAVNDCRRWTPSGGDINEMYLQDKASLIDAALCGFRKQCHICDQPSIGDDVYGRPWCASHTLPLTASVCIEGLEEWCCECGGDIETYDVYGRAWCFLHAPGQPLQKAALAAV
jgi:DNA primase